MKKTLIATAIAASMASFAVSAADAKIYGNIQLALPYADTETGTETESSYGLKDNGSTIGIKGSHEIAPGLKGFFKAELEFAADDKAASKGLNKLEANRARLDEDLDNSWEVLAE
ncbi:MAG: porin, partial [Gammaproteobacteria bacterium]|nr:porin [Gammaproteobacteria bacterium]